MDASHPLAKDPNVHTSTLAAYETLFPSNEKLRVEGTTHYLYQKTARRHLSQMDSRPLIIAVVRDPARRVWSSFQYTRNNLARMDPSLSFDQYVEWALQDELEKIADHISHPGSAYVLARDVKYGCYVNFLRRWRDAVGQGRMFVVSFDSVVSDSRNLCRHIASLLEVDESLYRDFDFRAKNTTYETVSQSVQTWARRIGRWMPRNPFREWLKKVYIQVATREDSSPHTEEHRRALQKLRDHYSPYNEQLSDEFDIEVSSWTQS
ncbi:hypothetical protein GGP98_002972 [Salinibacter ruber]|nr:hypothetical protein [Salinibacter ruber]